MLKHGKSGTPEYRAWAGMKARCSDEKSKGYENYGGRGISVWHAWENDFEAFFAHVGPKPTDQKRSLDRINNDGNYEPGNVRWATYTEQANNRRPHSPWSKPAPTHCKHGHELTPENTYEYEREGRRLDRQCKICSFERVRLRRSRIS